MRTHYSSPRQLEVIRNDDIRLVHAELSYFMWESSTSLISRLGLPTNDDVREWVTVLSHRKDAKTNQEVALCIADCEDYINNTRTAFVLLRKMNQEGS